MPIVNTTGLDGTTLTADQSATFSYFKYDPNLNQLVALREVKAQLNSFLLGDQHKISSGGENIFFSNFSSDIDWFPAWSGILAQSNPANQGRSGVIPPSIRTYGDLVPIEVYGTISTGATPYADSVTLVGANSLYGLVFITEEAIAADDHISYHLHKGTDGTGIEMYNQRFTGTAYAVGDTVTLWFAHPLETMPGTTIYTHLDIAVGSQDGTSHVLSVRKSVEDKHWSRAQIRPFIDANIHHRRRIIHSADSFNGTYTFLDRDGGSEVHLETTTAVMLLDCSVLTDNFELRVVNTSPRDQELTITNATFIGFRQGGEESNLAIGGNHVLVIEGNSTVEIFITENAGSYFVNMLVPTNRGEHIALLQQQVLALQNAESLFMDLEFPPGTPPNGNIVSMPLEDGGYIFWDAQITGNMQELIWP